MPQIPFRDLSVESEPRTVWGWPSLTDDGFVLATRALMEPTGWDSAVYVQGFDRRARPLEPAWRMGNPDTPEPSARDPRIVAGGDRALVTWYEKRPEDPEVWRLMARVVDRLGRPVNEAIDISGERGKEPWRDNDPLAVWDGERFVLFWIPLIPGENSRLLMTAVKADGQPGSPLTRVVTDDIDGSASTIYRVYPGWTGAHYLLAADVAADDDFDLARIMHK